MLEQRFGENVWQQFSLVTEAAVLTVPGLVIHDHDDRHVPFNAAEQIAEYWPNSEAMLTKNLGHHRILREDAVMQRILSFMVG